MKNLLPKIHYLVPPIALDIYRKVSGRYEFSGNYATWDEAQACCSGYDEQIILESVRDSLLKVVHGEAAFERDSVLYNEPRHWWPLLAGLLWVTSRNSNKLNLLDFGGSLGTVYFQNCKFINHLDDLKWSVVEQRNFADCGRQYFQNNQLKFYYDIAECTKNRNPDVILFSGVLQYLEKPYEILEEVIGQRFKQIIIDRTPFLEKGVDCITIQKVHPAQYPASYPAWFFNLARFVDFITPHYELIADFDSFDRFRTRDVVATAKGFIFEKRQ